MTYSFDDQKYHFGCGWLGAGVLLCKLPLV
jgi:hypothetical protein